MHAYIDMHTHTHTHFIFEFIFKLWIYSMALPFPFIMMIYEFGVPRFQMLGKWTILSFDSE